jgi:hypothetical protein
VAIPISEISVIRGHSLNQTNLSVISFLSVTEKKMKTLTGRKMSIQSSLASFSSVESFRSPAPAPRHWLVRAVLAIGLASASFHASAQQLEPRSYANIPVGMNFLVTAYGYTEGPVSTDDASPLQDAQIQTHVALLGYARSFGFLGTSAKIDVVEGLAWVSGQATFAGQPVSRTVSGLIDPQFRASINLYGAPALSMKDFANYQQNLIVGMQLAVTAPLGRYDSGKLLNISTHRWSIRPELGISKAFGPLTLELTPGVTIFTDNDDFLGEVKHQDPLFSLQGHAIYSFGRGIWASVSGTYYTGGTTTVGGVNQHDLQENFRAGATVSLPLGRRESVKLYGSDGVLARTGTSFWLVGIAFQYRWGGGI